MPSLRTRARRRRFDARSHRYELYQQAVQAPDEDLRYLVRVYRNEHGRDPRHLREDFCGTALLASRWVRRGARRSAEGFDIDPEPLAWGLEHNLEPIGAAAARCVLHLEDVRSPSHRPPDLRVAFNFSYCALKTRAEMLAYFESCHADLAPGGIFLLDLHGGWESIQEMEETRRIEGGFTYVWEQGPFSPVTGIGTRWITFRFRDGSQRKRAFRYHWRIWTLPELRDLLEQAGFRRVDVYFEGAAEDGESGNGIFRKTRLGENCASWVAYLAAVR